MKTEKVSTKKNKRNYVIIALIIILLLLGVGYASFSETLTIDGTASGSMKWEVKFEADNSTTGVVEEVDDEGHTLTVTTDSLKYPGDAVKVPVIIKNNSSVGIKLTDFQLTDNNPDSGIKIDYIDLNDGNEKIAAEGTCRYYFIIKWDEKSNQTSVNDTYKFTFTYEQDTKTKDLKPFHSIHS